MKRARRNQQATIILAGDVWTSKMMPNFKVRVLRQTDTTITLSYPSGAEEKMPRSKFLGLYTFEHRTQRWDPAT